MTAVALRSILLGCCFSLFFLACQTEPNLGPRPCLDDEYVIDDLGGFVTYRDFDSFRFHPRQIGDVRLLDGDLEIYAVLDRPFNGFELEIDAFPSECMLRFEAGGYYYAVCIWIDTDRNITTIQAVSDLCTVLDEPI